jgi:hypothetical protein
MHRRGQREHVGSAFGSDKPCRYLLSLRLRSLGVHAFQSDPCWHPTHMGKIRHRAAWSFPIRGLSLHGAKETLDGTLQWFNLSLEPRQGTLLHQLLDLLLHRHQPSIVPDFLASELFFFAELIAPINQAEDSELVSAANSAEDTNECIDAVNCLAAVMGLISRLIVAYANETKTLIFHRASPIPLSLL